MLHIIFLIIFHYVLVNLTIILTELSNLISKNMSRTSLFLQETYIRLLMVAWSHILRLMSQLLRKSLVIAFILGLLVSGISLVCLGVIHLLQLLGIAI